MSNRYGFHEGTDGCPVPWRDLSPVMYLFGGPDNRRLCGTCGAIKTPTRTVRTVHPKNRDRNLRL